MAASPNLFPAVLLLLIVYLSKAATVPRKMSSAHGQSGQEMTPHGLDLADLSLPPEVITEALFTQTDFLQDQLEQCEERVRNNLKGDDKAETDGIEDYEDDDDDDDSDDDEDDLNRKIAQMAAKAFSQFRKDDAGDVTHQESSDRGGEGHGGHVADHSAARSKSGAAKSPAHGKGKADDAGDVKGKKEKEEEGEEYIVYEYEEAADNDTVQDQEGQVDGQKDEQKLQDEQDPHEEDSRHETRTKDNREGITTRDRENPVTGPPTTTLRSDPAKDSADSDAEEPQPPPEEVNLSSITTNDSHSQENSHNSDSAASQERKETTQDPPSTPKSTTNIMDTDDSNSSGNGDVTAARTDRTDSGKDRTTAPVQRSAKSQRKEGDNNSEDSRVKRSLSLDHVLMNQAVDRGTHKDVHRLTFGKSRIRRQTSPREEVRSWLTKHAGHAGRHQESPVKHLLRSLLIRTHGGSYPIMRRQKTADTILDHDFTKTDEETVLRDVIKMTGNAKTYDMVQMAEKFLDSLKNFQPSHQRLGDLGDDLEVRRLLAPPTPPSGEERIRRRRGSRLGPGLSPERYVPLIEQLVERLNYLQHSVRVCHMLLPPEHLPANFTAQA